MKRRGKREGGGRQPPPMAENPRGNIEDPDSESVPTLFKFHLTVHGIISSMHHMFPNAILKNIITVSPVCSFSLAHIVQLFSLASNKVHKTGKA